MVLVSFNGILLLFDKLIVIEGVEKVFLVLVFYEVVIWVFKFVLVVL